MRDTLEVVENFRRNIKKWHAPVDSVVYHCNKLHFFAHTIARKSIYNVGSTCMRGKRNNCDPM